MPETTAAEYRRYRSAATAIQDAPTERRADAHGYPDRLEVTRLDDRSTAPDGEGANGDGSDATGAVFLDETGLDPGHYRLTLSPAGEGTSQLADPVQLSIPWAVR